MNLKSLGIAWFLAFLDLGDQAMTSGTHTLGQGPCPFLRQATSS